MKVLGELIVTVWYKQQGPNCLSLVVIRAITMFVWEKLVTPQLPRLEKHSLHPDSPNFWRENML